MECKHAPNRLSNGRFLMLSAAVDNWLELNRQLKGTWAGTTPERLNEINENPTLLPPYPPAFLRARGYLVVLDWQEKRIMGALEMPIPLGFMVEDKKIRVLNWLTEELAVVEGNQVTRTVNHPLFNHAHTLEPTSHDSFFITSSGSDLILDMTAEGQILWEWWAPEHGFEKLPEVGEGAKKKLLKDFNYNFKYVPVRLKSTHVNSCIEYDENSVLVTSFCTGELLHIDCRTGEAEVVLKDLKGPHSVRRTFSKKDGFAFTVCNTMEGRIVFLSEDLKRSRELKCVGENLHWIQDCVELSNGQLIGIFNTTIPFMQGSAIEVEGTNTVSEIDPVTGDMVSSLDTSRNTRNYLCKEITEEQALYWAEQWGGPPTSDFFKQWKWRDRPQDTTCDYASKAQCW